MPATKSVVVTVNRPGVLQSETQRNWDPWSWGIGVDTQPKSKTLGEGSKYQLELVDKGELFLSERGLTDVGQQVTALRVSLP